MTFSLLESLWHAQPQVSGMALEIAWKAALACLAVTTLHAIVGRSNLLLRSAMWNTCLIGLVVLPAVIAVFPRLQFVSGLASSVGRVEGQTKTDNAATGALTEGDSADVSVTSANTLATPDAPSIREAPINVASVDGSELVVEQAERALPENVGLLVSYARPVMETILPAACVTYLLIVAALLLRLGKSLAAVSALRGVSTAIANPEWLNSLSRWHSHFGLRRPVLIRQSNSISVPVVVGWRQPMVLLPSSVAESVDQQAIDAVLLHELTHVSRADYAWNLLLRIVQAFYWPHPFVWLTGHFVRQVREEVCDSVCVRWMGDVGKYSEILVDVAICRVGRTEPALGMAMSNSSRLLRRLARIEGSSGITRGMLSRPARAVVTIVALGAVSILGSVHLVAQATPVSESPIVAEPAAGNDEQPVAADKSDKTEKFEQRRLKVDTGKQAPESSNGSNPDTEKTITLRTIKVTRGRFEKTAVEPTTLEASGQMSVYARHSGVISRIQAALGDQVKTGDVLAEMDARDLDSELADKEAAFAQTEADEERCKAAVMGAKANVATRNAELNEAKAEADRTAANEQLSKKQLARMKDLYNTKSVDEKLVDEKEQQFQAAKADSRAAAAKIQTVMATVDRSRVDVVLAEASLKVASLRLAASKVDVERSRVKRTKDFREITSPIDGVILERTCDENMSVKAGEGLPLFRIGSAQLLTAVVNLPERVALRVRRDNLARVEFEALENDRIITSKVSHVAASLNVVRTLRAEIVIPNPEGRLKPGVSGQATIVYGEIPDVLSIPRSAIFYDFQRNFQCLRVIDDRTVLTPVKLGLNNGERVVIEEGLEDGDVIVADITGVQLPKPGANPQQ